MTSRVGVVIGFLLLYAITGFFHFAAWRWLSASAPRFVARYRRWLLASGIALFCLPLGRALALLVRDFAPFSIAAAIGLLWHLTVVMSTAVVGGFRALAWLYARSSSRKVSRESPSQHGETTDVARPPDAQHGETTVGVETLPVGRRQILESTVGAMAFAASGGTLAWGTVRGRYEWAVEEVAIRLPKLPKALDGFTIVQLSDLHVGTFVGERELAMGLELVGRIRADLITITGDIVDSDPHYVPLAASRLGALRARHGVVCIPGNHDYYTGEGAVLGGMQRAGIDVLLNRGKVIAPGDGGGFALLGVADLSARGLRGSPGPDLDLARSMVSPDLATVLLAHQPRFCAFASRAGIDLQLSGHTHGGQINPGFRPIDFLYRYVAGRYVAGATQLYVNRGFGTVGPPTRVGAPPEITKIILLAG